MPKNSSRRPTCCSRKLKTQTLNLSNFITILYEPEKRNKVATGFTEQINLRRFLTGRDKAEKVMCAVEC